MAVGHPAACDFQISYQRAVSCTPRADPEQVVVAIGCTKFDLSYCLKDVCASRSRRLGPATAAEPNSKSGPLLTAETVQVFRLGLEDQTVVFVVCRLGHVSAIVSATADTLPAFAHYETLKLLRCRLAID